MLTHKQRILKVAKGEMADKIPFVPRLDLWHNANSFNETLAKKYTGMTADEISRDQGWALHKIVPEYLKYERPEDIDHGGLGLYHLKEFLYKFTFPSDVDIRVKRTENETVVEYHTPVGMIRTKTGITDQMRKAGASIKWSQEHAIKTPADYRVCTHIFGNLKFEPDYTAFNEWKKSLGEDGIAAGQSIGIACASPVHFIQKTLLDATEFFLHYNDYPKEMQALAEAVENCYNQILPILADSPADVILWAGNVDSMITYPSYFEKEILPWCQKASDALHAKGKLMMIHPDGENEKLMDLIVETGTDICEAVTPYPMTKVTIDDYYDRWCRSDKLTIWGGIPEMVLLEKSMTEEEFDAYLDHMMKVISPGSRFIAGIGDTCPPDMVFERLVKIGDRFEQAGRLPLEAGAFRPQSEEQLEKAAQNVTVKTDRIDADTPEDDFTIIQTDVLTGNNIDIIDHIKASLARGIDAKQLLDKGMLAAMEIIGERFKDGSVFIPEVLLSARAINEATLVLEPHLSGTEKDAKGKILIGTVQGDLHDIGKNMVVTMLRGVGFDIVDMGINIKAQDFVKQVNEQKPDILGLSALLTTTMPEMKTVIDALAEAGLRDQVKIIVGGAPVNQKYADDIGADGYGSDAGATVALCRTLLKG